MGEIFTLDNDVLELARQCLDDLITELGKECMLVFPPKEVACDCVDGIGKLGGSFAQHGGPIRLPQGKMCQLCGGKGVKYETVQETIKMTIDWDVAKNEKFEGIKDIRKPGGVIRTKGYVWDIPRIKQCQYLIAQIDMEPYIPYKYKLVGEPISAGSIVKNRYFEALWERI